MLRVAGALWGAFLLVACAAVAQNKEVAQQAPAEACTTGTTAQLKDKAAANEADLKADYKGDRLKSFLTYIAQFLDNPMLLANTDQVLIFQKGRAAFIMFFKQDCAIGHATGPWEAVEPFIGRSA